MSEITALLPVSFALLVQLFFTEYLVVQRALSPRNSRRGVTCPPSMSSNARWVCR